MRGSLASALNAKKDESIGEVMVAWGAYKIGDFVFAEDRDTSWTVSMPMTQSELDREKEKGSLLRDWFTVIGVPKSYVRMVLPSKA